MSSVPMRMYFKFSPLNRTHSSKGNTCYPKNTIGPFHLIFNNTHHTQMCDRHIHMYTTHRPLFPLFHFTAGIHTHHTDVDPGSHCSTSQQAYTHTTHRHRPLFPLFHFTAGIHTHHTQTLVPTVPLHSRHTHTPHTDPCSHCSTSQQAYTHNTYDHTLHTETCSHCSTLQHVGIHTHTHGLTCRRFSWAVGRAAHRKDSPTAAS